MKKHIYACALSFALTQNSAEAQVVGGQSIFSNVDFFCSLVEPPAGSVILPSCGAALIHPSWVLTAGHCSINPNTMKTLDSLDIVISPYIRTKGSTYIKVRSKKIFTHKQFDMATGMTNDIALIQLRTPVTSVAPVQLPAQGDNSLTQHDDTCYVAGYGLYDISQQIQPDTLQIAEIDIIHNDTCNLPQHYNGDVEPGMVCAGKLTGGNKGGAAGDSGGPLFAKTPSGPVQIGIVSWGQGQYSTPQYPGLYTRVASYRQWIDSVINSVTSVDDLAAENTSLSRKDDELLLSLVIPAQHDLSYAIYTIDGRAALHGIQPKGRQEYSIDISQLEEAIYIIRVTDGAGYSYAAKLPLLR